MLALTPTPVPLVNWDDGTVRVTGTRVPLETVVHAFRHGATPEEITQRYTTVTLDAAYAVIAWVLQHAAEVDSYIARRAAISAQIREGEEQLHPAHGIRERLLARKHAK